MVKHIKYFLLVFVASFSFVANAQLYPVQVNTNFVPPYNVTLSSYTTTTTNKINLRLNLTDINENNLQIRLKMKITGRGLNIQSRDFIIGALPIFLNGGQILDLTSYDLRPYFELQNLAGINPQQYNRPLPDGFYKICFEVYTANTPIPQLISNPNMGCTFVNLIVNDPPILNLPQRGEQIVLKDPINIIFQWTPRHLNATNVSYDFEIREIWDNNIDPQAGFLASPPLYSETIRSTTFLYNNTKPALLPDKTYAWRVRAISTNGISENSVFRNKGYSEIFYIKTTQNCDAPIYAMSEALSTGRVKITWQGKPEHNKYHVQYKKTDVADAEWFEVFTYNQQAQISNLEAGVTYDFRVGGTCNSLTQFEQSYTFTNVNQFTMPTEEETVNYNCGVLPDIQIDNQDPLQNIGVNETFTAGDFPVTVKEVQGSNGKFTGKGFIVVPYLADTKIAVAFEGITINTKYQLIDGVVKTTYDPTFSNVESADEFINDIVDLISDLFNTNDAVNDVYADGVIDEDEIEILIESQEDYASAIDELEGVNPRTEEQQELLDALQQNNENLSEVIENAGNGNNTISESDNASQSQEEVNNLTKVTIYFNDALQEYEIPNNSAFPSISGVPIKLNSFEKLGINDFGGLGWFVINGVKYLGCYTNSKFRGYYPKTFLDNIQEEQKVVLATKENLDAFNEAEFKGYSIAQSGEQVFTIAKRVEGGGATLDCICEYKWIVEDVQTTVQQPVKNKIPPERAIRNNCTGVACNTAIFAGGLGSNAFDAITEAHPEIANETEKLEKLEELKNYLDELTLGKTVALYNTEYLKDIYQNSLTYYRTYFKDNYIYSKELFLEHFPNTTFSRDVEIIFSKVDLRKNLNENYNTNSIDYLRGGKYYYDFADLTSRYVFLYTVDDPGVIGTEILNLEADGKANALSVNNGYQQYVAKWGTDAAWMFIAEWSAIYAQDIVDGTFGAVAVVKVSKIFGQAVKSPSLWKKFLGIFKKSQKVKNKAQQALVNNFRARQLVDDLADNPAFQGIYDNAGFKFKLPNQSGEGFVDVIEVGYDGRILIKDERSLQNLLDEFDEIKINFPEGSNIRYGNQSYSSGRLEVDNDGIVKFTRTNTFNGIVDEIDGIVTIRTQGGIEVSRGNVTPMSTIDNDYDVLQMTIVTKGTNISGRESVEQTIKYIEETWEQPVEGFLINWKKVEGLSDNIDTFNTQYLKYKADGFDETVAKSKAYLDTFSGKMATEQGFTKLHYINGVKDDSGTFTSIEGLITE